MNQLDSEFYLIIICSLVVLSYLFSIIGQLIKIPSVLLLLLAGILIQIITRSYDISFRFPPLLVESLGVVGLIMIVLEAGLDLELNKDKIPLIRDSLLSASVILFISASSITALLHWWLDQPIRHCIVYALPLSIISSAIVIPSLHHLTPRKKEFLVYEASFSDIVGILLFNYFTAKEVLTAKSIFIFGGNILFSLVFSFLLSVLLFVIMAKTKLNIKFFLIFSLLILIYAGGKMLHLPSLIIIILFGLMINNWHLVRPKRVSDYFPSSQVSELRHLLHSITAESSFLIRTFFFILFGFSINLDLVVQKDVMLIGSLIVGALFLIRLLYLRFFLRTNLFPEAFFLPRGLITIVLFYKIPLGLRLSSFNEGILFFVILTTSIIMAIGMIFYQKKPEEVVEERSFIESNIL